MPRPRFSSLRPLLASFPLLLPLALAGCAGAPPAAAPAPTAGEIRRLDGSTIAPEALSERIEAIARAADVPGLTVTVWNDARPVYSRAFGYADRPAGRPLTTATELYGASLSKAVFSVLVMKLVDRGLLDLDTPLQELVDEPLADRHGSEWHQDFSDLADDPRYRQITARMTLAHTSGLPNWRWFDPDQKLRIHFAPGTRYAYSGEGMVLLQLVLEKLTGLPFEELAQREIFEPYGMTMSSYTWQERFDADHAMGHRPDGTTYPRDTDNAARAPSTLETTTEDYVRFVSAVLRGEGLSEASWSEIFRPQVRIRSRTQFGPGALEETSAHDAIELSYGLGWGLRRTPHGWGAFKEGNGDGFDHYSIVYPDRETGVLILTNSDNGLYTVDELLKATVADTSLPVEWQGWVKR